jgi:hypothetical protein
MACFANAMPKALRLCTPVLRQSLLASIGCAALRQVVKTLDFFPVALSVFSVMCRCQCCGATKQNAIAIAFDSWGGQAQRKHESKDVGQSGT